MIFAWILPLRWILARANRHGRVTLQQVDLSSGLGWHCSIRPTAKTNGYAEKPRYAWTASSRSMKAALWLTVRQAEGNPIEKIDAPPGNFKPVLGGREFDGDRP